MSEIDIRSLFVQVGLPVTDEDIEAVAPLYRMVVADVEKLSALIGDRDGIPLIYNINQK